MRLLLFFLFLTLFSCKRNHTNVFIKTVDNETGQPVPNIKIKVYRKGKENFFIKKESLVIAEGTTNSQGENLLDFKYDRGNEYTVEVFQGNGYWGNTLYLWTDLEKGKNSETFYLYQTAYLKLNLKSINPNQKHLSVEVETASSGSVLYASFYNHINPIDSVLFKTVAANRGNNNIKWIVDSSGYRKNYSAPIILKGHDTTYATINF